MLLVHFPALPAIYTTLVMSALSLQSCSACFLGLCVPFGGNTLPSHVQIMLSFAYRNHLFRVKFKSGSAQLLRHQNTQEMKGEKKTECHQNSVRDWKSNFGRSHGVRGRSPWLQEWVGVVNCRALALQERLQVWAELNCLRQKGEVGSPAGPPVTSRPILLPSLCTTSSE